MDTTLDNKVIFLVFGLFAFMIKSYDKVDWFGLGKRVKKKSQNDDEDSSVTTESSSIAEAEIRPNQTSSGKAKSKKENKPKQLKNINGEAKDGKAKNEAKAGDAGFEVVSIKSRKQARAKEGDNEGKFIR